MKDKLPKCDLENCKCYCEGHCRIPFEYEYCPYARIKEEKKKEKKNVA